MEGRKEGRWKEGREGGRNEGRERRKGGSKNKDGRAMMSESDDVEG